MHGSTDKLRFTKQPYIETTEPHQIKSMKFSMLSDDEVRKASEVDIWRGYYYDSLRKPLANGLLDPKMGPANKNSGLCMTCQGNVADCPGHFGCFTLELPVYNVGYFGVILDILKCICKSCSCVLLEESVRVKELRKMRNPHLDSLRKARMKKKIVQMCSSRMIKCFRCGYQNGKVKKGSGLTILHDRPKIVGGDHEDGVKQLKPSAHTPILKPTEVLSLFKRIQDEDCELLYLADRPEKLLITSIPVPPITLRPSVFVEGGMQSNESDITERLKQIIQANAMLHQQLQEIPDLSRCLNAWDVLQFEVALYINSEARLPVPPGVVIKKQLSGFVQRLKGKQGRFRGNLSGKRVEYTGRTVISPDPNLKITEVAIPILMATILTYPECATQHNIEKLRQCVRNGPKKYPGAKFVKEPNGSLRDLSFTSRKRIADELKFGYIVYRHLEDGDVVLFNRQPSLHRMSIMCHRARIMPWRTLRFNESVCNPYNADFDGDEMNLHVPQTEQARTEALMLMGVQNNLCTPKNGVVLVASTQDFLTSSFLVTRKDTFYDRAAFSLLCSYMGDGMDLIDLPTPALLKPVELWTGKQLFSVLLRPHAGLRVYVNLMVKEKSFSKPQDRKIKYQDETMCPNDGFVYFRNSELISGQLGKATLGNGNKIGLYSVLLRDYNAHAAAACMNRLAKLSARWIGNHGFSIGIDDVQPGRLLNEQKSCRISDGYEECDRLIQSYNNGKLTLMPGCDAAQTLEAKITKSLNEIRETTSKVCMKELHWRNSPLIMSQCGSKGSPINISQMVACVGQQAVGGRRAPDGFIDRSLPHFPRKSKTPAAKGFVASSFYSGLTATEFFFHTMGGREGLVDTAVKTADTGYMSRRLMKGLEDLAVYYDMTVRSSGGTIIQFCYGDDGMDPAQMEGAEGFPLDLERLRLKVEATCPAGKNAGLSPSELEEILQRRLPEYDMISGEGCSEAFKEKLLEFFTVRLAKKNCRIAEQQLQVFLDACNSRLRLKQIEAGTAIGAIGAQSIGEPGTQMTLKTFHFAGVASMNVTLGVPRIKEIINASKKISTPIITANLERDNDMGLAEAIKAHIEKTMLGQVAKSIKLEMTSIRASVVVKLDMKKINSLRLGINAYTVQGKISEFFRRKRKDIKQLNVKVLDDMKLAVIPEAEKADLHFALHWVKNRLPLVVIKGIQTVERAIIAEEDGKKGKLQLIVEGMGLKEVMGVDGVDGCKTESNHVMEVQATLGIEAARNCIIKEIRKVMQSHSMEIDIRHMMLLADLMTFKGEVLAMTRDGIQKMKDSVLMLASFERTADHLFNASASGKEDMIDGVSECIIVGVPMRVGTGMLEVQQRVQQPKLTYGPDPIIS
ncbi:DNA-directed RNA polymerase III subunit 1, variant 2 [Ancistrocladus abbreviatus]